MSQSTIDIDTIHASLILAMYNSANLEGLKQEDFNKINNFNYSGSFEGKNPYNSKFKEQALFNAINSGSKDVVAHALNHLKISKNTLNKAFLLICTKGDLNMLKFFTEYPLIKESLNIYMMNGMALKKIVVSQNEGALNYLLKYDYSDKQIQEAFKIACQKECLHSVNYLMKKKKKLIDIKIINWLEANVSCSNKVRSLVKSYILYDKLTEEIPNDMINKKKIGLKI